MSEKADEVYNVGLSLLTNSVSRGKENVRPLRVIEPSLWLRSPFVNNNKTIIEPHELKIYEKIMTLCNDPNHQDRRIINMNNCRVSLNQLGNSTKPNGWVDSWVINAFYRKLFKDKHPKHSDKHFFFHTSVEFFLEKWPNEYMKNIWHKNIIKKFLAVDSAKKLHLSERLHFPTLYDDHWFLFVVDIKTRNFLFLDPLYGQTSKLHQQVDEKLILNFRKTWKDCKLKDLHFESFGKHYPRLPQQKTGNDCGVFTIKYMEKFCTRNPQSYPFSAKDIPDFRVRIAIDTFFNNHNYATDQMDFISTFDIKSYKRDNGHWNFNFEKMFFHKNTCNSK